MVQARVTVAKSGESGYQLLLLLFEQRLLKFNVIISSRLLQTEDLWLVQESITTSLT